MNVEVKVVRESNLSVLGLQGRSVSIDEIEELIESLDSIQNKTIKVEYEDADIIVVSRHYFVSSGFTGTCQYYWSVYMVHRNADGDLAIAILEGVNLPRNVSSADAIGLRCCKDNLNHSALTVEVTTPGCGILEINMTRHTVTIK